MHAPTTRHSLTRIPSMDEIFHIIGSMGHDTSLGPDDITTRLLKEQ
jgi:hypothetical protein